MDQSSTSPSSQTPPAHVITSVLPGRPFWVVLVSFVSFSPSPNYSSSALSSFNPPFSPLLVFWFDRDPGDRFCYGRVSCAERWETSEEEFVRGRASVAGPTSGARPAPRPRITSSWWSTASSGGGGPLLIPLGSFSFCRLFLELDFWAAVSIWIWNGIECSERNSWKSFVFRVMVFLGVWMLTCSLLFSLSELCCRDSCCELAWNPFPHIVFFFLSDPFIILDSIEVDFFSLFYLMSSVKMFWIILLEKLELS